jgi:hypothetical protein
MKQLEAEKQQIKGSMDAQQDAIVYIYTSLDTFSYAHTQYNN